MYRALGTVYISLLAAIPLLAQTPARMPDWRRIGTPAVDLSLASPATGPVDGVWFAPDASRLYIRTRSGKLFETEDFDTWRALSAPPEVAPLAAIPAARLPEPNARSVVAAADPAHIYALGQHLYRSEDGGRSWMNVTAFRRDSVIGNGQRGVAVSPLDRMQIVAANDFGVWRSLDGGLSWSGLNQSLPNLPARRILALPAGGRPARIEADGLGVIELAAGAPEWVPASDARLEAEIAARQQYSAALGVMVTALASAGDTVYAGSSDGRIWVSFDGFRTSRLVRPELSAAVERIFVDPSEPRVALAALSGGTARLLKTTTAGTVWDDLTGNLPDGALHGVTADRAAGAIYVANDHGVFTARADLNNAGLPNAVWTALSGLPDAPATDVRLDLAGNQLYVALDGYGLYAAMAPHRATALRVVNAADFSSRPAAPGSLLSVIGGRVSAVSGAGISYPLLAASDGGTQFQVPFEATGTNVALALKTGTGSITHNMALLAVSPAIFIGPEGAPMVLDADTGLLLDGRNVAHSGMRIQILATGLGRVRPDWPTGMPAPLENAPVVVAPVRAFLDRQPVTVTRAMLAPGYIGLYVIEVQLPSVVNAGQVELYLSAGTQDSNRVQFTLEP